MTIHDLLTFEFLVFFLAGIAGMFVHWFKMWVRKETDASLYAYLIKRNARYTAYAFMVYVGLVGGLLMSGTSMDFGSIQTIGLAVLAGYNIDGAVNKDLKSAEKHEDAVSSV